jgi:hypothetical protein
MRSRTTANAAVLTAVLVCVLTLPPTRAEGPLPGVSLTGYWKLDRERSDDPKQKVREAMEGMRTGEYTPGGESPTGPGVDVMTPGDPRTRNPTGPGGGVLPPYGGQPGRRGQSPYGGGGDPRAAVLPEIDRPKELLIAQRTSLVLIQEGDDEDSVRGVHTDGQRRPIPGGGGEMSGAWEEGKLVVETWRDDGVRRTETFELSADGRELTVIVSIAAPQMPSLTIKSLYQITPSPPS